MGTVHHVREHRKLGSSDLRVTSVGLGAWQWGDTNFWTYGKDYDRKDLEEVWWATLEAGVNWVDTAEVYGKGASETILGEMLAQTDPEVIVASKVFPDKDSALGVRQAAEASLKRLGIDVIDLYQVHWWPPKLPIGELMRGMDGLARDGLVRYVGVSNFSVAQVEEAQSHLEHARIVSNQVHYSLLHREPEEEGLVEHHAENGIAIIAYSPLEQGILTGKYTPDHRPGGFRADKARFSPKALEAVQLLLETLGEVAVLHGRSTAQAALAWLLKDPNVVVIPGAKNLRQLEENVGGAGWHIPKDELGQIEEAYRAYAGRL